MSSVWGEAEMPESEWKQVWRSGFWGEVTAVGEEGDGGTVGERKDCEGISDSLLT